LNSCEKLEPYKAAAVGEVGDAQRGLEIMAEYTSGGDKVQMCYPFEMLQPARLTAGLAKLTFDRLAAAAPDAWPCWAYSNHDTVRHITRWQLSDAGARVYATMLMCLRGSVCLYQGEELGLPEAEIAFEDVQDPYGIEFWPEFKGRDGCRTPMIWQTDNALCGFSTAQKAWLPVTAPHRPLSVAAQEFSFVRTGAEVVFCAFNLGPSEARVTLPEGRWERIGEAVGSVAATAGTGEVRLSGWGCCIARRV